MKQLAEPFESWTSQVNKLSLNEDHITSGDCIASGWGTTFSVNKSGLLDLFLSIFYRVQIK